MTIVMGLDLSLTGTALVVFRPDKTAVFGKVLRQRLYPTEPRSKNHPDEPGNLRPNGKYRGSEEERIDFIANQVMKMWRKYQPVAVGIEQYAFSRHSRGLSGLHELGGVVKNRLFRKEALVLMPQSTEIKKFATNNGNAKKPQMIAAAQALGCDTEDDNVADAFHIARWTSWKLAS